MKLTQDKKDYIDSLSYERLLSHVRFAPLGDPWFEGETGDYWGKRMTELRSKPGGNETHVTASKTIGWDK
jgi:hypothetical protein